MRRVLGWIPFLTLLGLAAGFLAKNTFAPPREELVIEPPPAARIAPMEIAARAHALMGRVVDPEGAGVPGALVWLRAGDEPHWAYTTSDGSFRLQELEAGPWKTTVVALGFAPLALEIAATDQPLTIRLVEPFGPPPTLPPIVRAPLTGTVRSAMPGSVEGCEVVLAPVLAPQDLAAPLPRRADVGPDGSFAFPDLITGAYHVEVRPSWARGGSWPDLAAETATGSGTVPLPKRRTLVHTAPTTTGVTGTLDIELATGDVVGKLVDRDFETVEGALLLLTSASDPTRVWPTTQSEPDGSFELKGIPAGRYALTARAGSATLVQEIEVRANETTGLPVAPLEVRRSR
jgi:hypothetical protein